MKNNNNKKIIDQFEIINNENLMGFATPEL